MAIPTPQDLIDEHGKRTPEQYAGLLGFQVVRLDTSPIIPGVTVLSEYSTQRTIHLYNQPLRLLAEQRQEPLGRLEQWHIAHELYHGLAEDQGMSAWRVRETE